MHGAAWLAVGGLWAWFGAGCGGPDEGGPGACVEVAAGPSDDPADWDDQVEPGAYTPVLSDAVWTIPGDGLPVPTFASNNNVSLLVADGVWYLAFRTAPTHFAWPETEMHVIASADEGATWTFEHTVALGTDVREPSLQLIDGVLSLSFFQGGDDPFAFEPQAVWRSERCAQGAWVDEVLEPDTTRVPWDRKVRGGVLYRTSYTGEHYGDGILDLHFDASTDGGRTFAPVGDDPVYHGGNSEAAFEIMRDGTLWAVTRNEDGDATGKGAMVCRGAPGAIGVWDCPAVSDPQRYDSPELIRHGDELYLLARRDLGGAYGEDDSILPYSTRPKRTALYRIDQDTREVIPLVDLPSAGDTAFVSAWRTGPHTWLLANYSSPIDQPGDLDRSWLDGQTNPRGTGIYLMTLTFAP